MGDDHVLTRDLRRDLPERMRDVFVRQSVEAVATHALFIIGARQRERVGHERMAAVEGGVEAGDLRRRRERLHRRLDAGDVVRLVQRRKRDQRPQLREHRRVDEYRLDQVRPAMNDAVAHGDDSARIADLLEPTEDGAHRRSDDRRGRLAGSKVSSVLSPVARLTVPLAFAPIPSTCPEASRLRWSLSAPNAANFSEDEPAFSVNTILLKDFCSRLRVGYCAALAIGGSPPKARPSRR